MGENRSNIAACLCALCSAIATLTSIISGVIYLVTNNQSYSATEWHNSTISNTENFQSIPFNAFDCPRDKYFYSLAFPVYLHIRSPENTGITLALQNGNTSDSHIIASCYANVNEVCSIALDGAENVFAFVTMDSVSEDNPVVGWSCSYFNLPFLITLSALSICSVLLLIFCCIAFLYGVINSCRSPVENGSRKWQFSKFLKDNEAQPLLKDVKVLIN